MHITKHDFPAPDGLVLGLARLLRELGESTLFLPESRLAPMVKDRWKGV